MQAWIPWAAVALVGWAGAVPALYFALRYEKRRSQRYRIEAMHAVDALGAHVDQAKFSGLTMEAKLEKLRGMGALPDGPGPFAGIRGGDETS